MDLIILVALARGIRIPCSSIGKIVYGLLNGLICAALSTKSYVCSCDRCMAFKPHADKSL